MIKHCKFSDIGQFREIVHSVTHRAQYISSDENGDPIYDKTKRLPIITFTGTCKIHGTNGGITFSRDGEISPQSKEKLLKIGDDNHGFAFFVEQRKEIFKEFIKSLDFKGYDYITIFGEFAGKGIQNKVAVSKLDKSFIIFDIKRSYDDVSVGKSIYSDEEEIKTLRSTENKIYNIYDYPTYKITIDFNDLTPSVNTLTDITTEISNECPVGKALGVIGHGEGVVYSYIDEHGNKYRFKIKGEEHKISNTKEIVPIDVEKVNSIKEFIEYSVTENRLEQGVQKVFGEGLLDIKKMGEFLKWLATDILKEETDVMLQNGLEPKEVTKYISVKGKTWLIAKMDTY